MDGWIRILPVHRFVDEEILEMLHEGIFWSGGWFRHHVVYRQRRGALMPSLPYESGGVDRFLSSLELGLLNCKIPLSPNGL